MSEDISNAIIHPRKRRDTTIAGVTRLEENIVDFEQKLTLTAGDHVTIYYLAKILQTWDAEFQHHQYKLVDCINDSGDLEEQQRFTITMTVQ